MLPSAQWMSSKTSSVGSRAASASTSTRAEKKSVSRSATSPSLVEADQHGQVRGVLLGLGRTDELLDGRAELLLRVGQLVAVEHPATCLTCCAKALYGLLAP